MGKAKQSETNDDFRTELSRPARRALANANIVSLADLAKLSEPGF